MSHFIQNTPIRAVPDVALIHSFTYICTAMLKKYPVQDLFDKIRIRTEKFKKLFYCLNPTDSTIIIFVLYVSIGKMSDRL